MAGAVAPRFDVVRTDNGWHARFRASNGRVVWTTEVHTTRRRALDAVWIVAETFNGFVHDREVRIWEHGSTGRTVAEVRDADERSKP